MFGLGADGLAVIILALAVAGMQLMDRLDKREERRRAEREKADKEQEHDADRSLELKEGRIEDLERCVGELETRLEAADRKVELMRQLMRMLFDELAKSDRCKRARLGCPTREAPGDMNPQLAALRAELEAEEVEPPADT